MVWAREMQARGPGVSPLSSVNDPAVLGEGAFREQCGVTEFGVLNQQAILGDMTWICLLSGPWSTPSPGTEEANRHKKKDNSPGPTYLCPTT